MKLFVIFSLVIIFVIFLTSSAPSIAEDFNENNVEIIEDSKYEIFLHVITRNANGELISVTETLPCKSGRNCAEYMPHEITDYAFDTSLGKKEIIIIDNIKYEKVQFADTFRQVESSNMNEHELAARWAVEVCGNLIEKYGFECATIFQSRNATTYLEIDDITTTNWTVLKQMK